MVLIEGIPWKWFAKRRVVESVPGYDGPRYCKKEEDENEEYACISHVWGEVQPTYIDGVTKDGLPFAILLNRNPIKATFIRDVAKDTFEYPTWLDVYSINQSSEDDKQSQMTVMADIYSKSTRCFIILESEGVYKSLLFEWYKPTVAIIRASIPTTDRRMAKHWDPSDSDILDDLHWVWGWHPRVMISVGSQFDFSLIREKAYDAVERLDMERSASDMVFKTPDFLKVFYMLSSFADQLAIFRNGQGWRHLHEAYENDDYNSRVWTFQERLLSKHKTYVSAYPEAEDYISVLIFHIPPNDVNQTLADYEVPEDRRKKVAENHTNGLTRILMHKSGYVGVSFEAVVIGRTMGEQPSESTLAPGDGNFGSDRSRVMRLLCGRVCSHIEDYAYGAMGIFSFVPSQHYAAGDFQTLLREWLEMLVSKQMILLTSAEPYEKYIGRKEEKIINLYRELAIEVVCDMVGRLMRADLEEQGQQLAVKNHIYTSDLCRKVQCILGMVYSARIRPYFRTCWNTDDISGFEFGELSCDNSQLFNINNILAPSICRWIFNMENASVNDHGRVPGYYNRNTRVGLDNIFIPDPDSVKVQARKLPRSYFQCADNDFRLSAVKDITRCALELYFAGRLSHQQGLATDWLSKLSIQYSISFYAWNPACWDLKCSVYRRTVHRCMLLLPRNLRLNVEAARLYGNLSQYNPAVLAHDVISGLLGPKRLRVDCIPRSQRFYRSDMAYPSSPSLPPQATFSGLSSYIRWLRSKSETNRIPRLRSPRTDLQLGNRDGL